MPCVLKEWVTELTLAEQGTLLTAVRGPDAVRKDHPIKQFLRAYRRAVLNGAHPVPGSFMSDQPTLSTVQVGDLLGGGDAYRLHWVRQLEKFFAGYVDDLPHHFYMHFGHCAEIVGYRHPDEDVARWWLAVYAAIVETFHMRPEQYDDMRRRLRDEGCF
jgi:hypothetical protein